MSDPISLKTTQTVHLLYRGSVLIGIFDSDESAQTYLGRLNPSHELRVCPRGVYKAHRPGLEETKPTVQNRFVRPSVDAWREPYDSRPGEHTPADCKREDAPYGCTWHCVVNNGSRCNHVHDMG